MIVTKRMSSSGYRHIDHTKDNDTHRYGPMPNTRCRTGPKKGTPPPNTNQKPEVPKPSVASNESNKHSCEGPTMDPVSTNLLLGLQHLRRLICQTRIANTSIISTAVQHGLLSHVSPHVPHALSKRYREKNKENLIHTHVPVSQKTFSTYSTTLFIRVFIPSTHRRQCGASSTPVLGGTVTHYTSRPAIMQHLNLVESALRFHAIHTRRNNADLLHIAGAVPSELIEPLVVCPSRGGRDDVCRGVQIDERLEVCGQVGEDVRGVGSIHQCHHLL